MNWILADASLHAMHDGTKGLSMWLLLPAQDIIDRFHATLMMDEQGDLIATRYNFPEIQVCVFYEFASTFVNFLSLYISKSSIGE